MSFGSTLLKGLGAVAVAALLQSAAARAQSPEPAPLSVYGAMPAMDMAQVSPSGDRLAYLAVVGEERSLIIHDLSDMSVIGGVRAGDVKVRDLGWIGETHVVLSTSATQSGMVTGLRAAELFEGKIYSIETRRVVNAFDRTPGILPRLGGSPILRLVDGEGIFLVGGAGYDGYGLFRIDPDTGAGRPVERPDRSGGGGWLVDGEGRPVARARYDGRTGEYEIQVMRGGFWRTVWKTTALLDPPGLVSLGPDLNSVVVSGAPDGRSDGLHLLNLTDGTFSELPFDALASAPIVHPHTRLLVGAVTQGEGEDHRQYTDPAMERAWRSLRTAFDGKRVSVTSWSHDLRQMVVFTEGTDDAGTYHLVDLDRGLAEVIGEAYPELGPGRVGEVRAVSYAAADGLRIPAYLTLPPGATEPQGLALVVLPHGGPAARDVMGFDWWAQALASRGYAVLQPQFRGSDGFGQAHLEAGYGEWGRKMQTDLSDGVRWLAAEGIVDPARVCIVGASYGGYAAMAGPTLDPGVYRCAVSIAGVSDLRRMVQWSASEAGGLRNSPVVRYWNRFMGAERLGDRGLDAFSPAHLADRADAPILLLHGEDDTVVPYEQSRIFAEALTRAGKPHELIPLRGEDHWLSRAETRQQMLTETVRFLETHNPAR
ncbi:S9 family peptidase [Brevundimonas sp.]|jgi:dipeptidyl aminopeptidase/acylaminoacyl peptidase|uniref:alpha/beta hydrolase family protein n=1 Tax=Brevundimonas sp. TaxID=1871086 RepID=UPI002E0FF9B7|nr:S9 family peptidase [Brevundimonas sp.]